MTRLLVALRSFSNAPKNNAHWCGIFYSCVSSPKRNSTTFGHGYNITWGYSAISGLNVPTSSAVGVYGTWFIFARIGRFNLTMFL